MSKTAEEWLEQTAPEKRAGVFKLILGYAPGVGKTYIMPSEAIRRQRCEYLYLGAIQRFLRNAPPVDVHIVTQRAD